MAEIKIDATNAESIALGLWLGMAKGGMSTDEELALYKRCLETVRSKPGMQINPLNL